MDEGGRTMPTIMEWVTMRDNKEGWYNAFFGLFMIHVVGATKFRNLGVAQFVSSFVSVSDEAFALLVLENCEERWSDMYKNNMTKSIKKNKYTDGGRACKTGRSRNLKGWSNKGLNRFNELYRLVKADRARKDMPFEGAFLQKLKEKYGGGRKRKLQICVTENEDDEQPEFMEDDMEIEAV
jgi:hypothetical protein